MKKIAILIGKSLLAQGALSYFKQHPENNVEVCSLDVFNFKEALEELQSFKPDYLIFESQHSLSDSWFSTSRLFILFPDLIMLELRADAPTIRVIRSEQYQPTSFADLMDRLGIHQAETPVAYPISTTGLVPCPEVQLVS